MWRPIVIDVVVLAGLALATLAVVGIVRIPNALVKVHASSKLVVVGATTILVACAVAGDLALAARGVLVVGFLLLTAPASAQAVARLALHERDRAARVTRRRAPKTPAR